MQIMADGESDGNNPGQQRTCQTSEGQNKEQCPGEAHH